jgi:hypothetical protein
MQGRINSTPAAATNTTETSGIKATYTGLAEPTLWFTELTTGYTPQYRQEVIMTEPGIADRSMDPVYVNLTFNGNVAAVNSIRVTVYNNTGGWLEFPSQITNIAYTSTAHTYYASCSVFFFDNQTMGSTQIYYIYYDPTYNTAQAFYYTSSFVTTTPLVSMIEVKGRDYTATLGGGGGAGTSDPALPTVTDVNGTSWPSCDAVDIVYTRISSISQATAAASICLVNTPQTRDGSDWGGCVDSIYHADYYTAPTAAGSDDSLNFAKTTWTSVGEMALDAVDYDTAQTVANGFSDYYRANVGPANPAMAWNGVYSATNLGGSGVNVTDNGPLFVTVKITTTDGAYSMKTVRKAADPNWFLDDLGISGGAANGTATIPGSRAAMTANETGNGQRGDGVNGAAGIGAHSAAYPGVGGEEPNTNDGGIGYVKYVITYTFYYYYPTVLCNVGLRILADPQRGATGYPNDYANYTSTNVWFKNYGDWPHIFQIVRGLGTLPGTSTVGGVPQDLKTWYGTKYGLDTGVSNNMTSKENDYPVQPFISWYSDAANASVPSIGLFAVTNPIGWQVLSLAVSGANPPGPNAMLQQILPNGLQGTCYELTKGSVLKYNYYYMTDSQANNWSTTANMCNRMNNPVTYTTNTQEAYGSNLIVVKTNDITNATAARGIDVQVLYSVNGTMVRMTNQTACNRVVNSASTATFQLLKDTATSGAYKSQYVVKCFMQTNNLATNYTVYTKSFYQSHTVNRTISITAACDVANLTLSLVDQAFNSNKITGATVQFMNVTGGNAIVEQNSTYAGYATFRLFTTGTTQYKIQTQFAGVTVPNNSSNPYTLTTNTLLKLGLQDISPTVINIISQPISVNFFQTYVVTFNYTLASNKLVGYYESNVEVSSVYNSGFWTYGNGYTYSVSAANVVTLTLSTGTTVPLDQTGAFTVYIYAMNASIATAVGSITVVVNALPTSVNFISSPLSVNFGLAYTTTFNYTQTGQPATTYTPNTVEVSSNYSSGYWTPGPSANYTYSVVSNTVTLNLYTGAGLVLDQTGVFEVYIHVSPQAANNYLEPVVASIFVVVNPIATGLSVSFDGQNITANPSADFNYTASVTIGVQYYQIEPFQNLTSSAIVTVSMVDSERNTYTNFTAGLTTWSLTLNTSYFIPAASYSFKITCNGTIYQTQAFSFTIFPIGIPTTLVVANASNMAPSDQLLPTPVPTVSTTWGDSLTLYLQYRDTLHDVNITKSQVSMVALIGTSSFYATLSYPTTGVWSIVLDTTNMPLLVGGTTLISLRASVAGGYTSAEFIFNLYVALITTQVLVRNSTGYLAQGQTIKIVWGDTTSLLVNFHTQTGTNISDPYLDLYATILSTRIDATFVTGSAFHDWNLTINTNAITGLSADSTPQVVITGSLQNYTVALFSFNMQVLEVPTQLEVPSSLSSIQAYWGDNFTLAASYENTHANKLLNGTIQSNYPAELLNGGFANATLGYTLIYNSTTIGVPGIYLITLTASLSNYASASFTVKVQILDVPTNMTVYINNIKYPSLATPELKQDVNFTVSYTLQDGRPVTGAVITLVFTNDTTGAVLNYTFAYSHGNYTIVINLNLNTFFAEAKYFTINAFKPNYVVGYDQPIVGVQLIPVQPLQLINGHSISGQQFTGLTPSNLVTFQIQLYDTSTRTGLSYGTNVVYMTATCASLAIYSKNMTYIGNGTFQLQFTMPSQYNRTVIFTLNTFSTASFNRQFNIQATYTYTFITAASTSTGIPLWLFYLIFGALIVVVAWFILYQVRFKYPPMVRKIHDLKRVVGRGRPANHIAIQKVKSREENIYSTYSKVINQYNFLQTRDSRYAARATGYAPTPDESISLEFEIQPLEPVTPEETAAAAAKGGKKGAAARYTELEAPAAPVAEPLEAPSELEAPESEVAGEEAAPAVPEMPRITKMPPTRPPMKPVMKPAAAMVTKPAGPAPGPGPAPFAPTAPPRPTTKAPPSLAALPKPSTAAIPAVKSIAPAPSTAAMAKMEPVENLYQQLVLLEQKRYKAERSLRDLEAKHSRGSITDEEYTEYNEKITESLNKLKESIAELRRKMISL